jgi:hypothetical protein
MPREILTGIPIKLHYNSDVKRVMLYYRETGPILELGTSKLIEVSEGMEFRFIEDSHLANSIKLSVDDYITLKPESVTELNYSPEQVSSFRIYPPSSDDWLSHVVEPGAAAIFTVQRIKGEKKKLLTIVDKQTRELYYAGLIQPYESAILTMNRDWSVHNKITYRAESAVDIFDLLKTQSLSWSSLSKLVEGVTIHNLTMHETMEETLSQLVPQSFSLNIRQQIVAFLSWISKAEIPKEDPIDFELKYQSVGIFRTLARGHIQCMLDDVEPPDYVRIMQLADRGQLSLSQRPQSEAAEQDPWNLVLHKLKELFPSWMGGVVDSAIDLKTKGQIVIELPVSKQAAKASRKAWSKRFAMAHHGLFMRGYVNKGSIGLIPTLYVGAAHRWPHKHLEWSGRLGYGSEKPRYLQIMTFPPTAIARITRTIPAIRLIDWEMSSFNLPLYNEKEQKWNLKTSLVCKSLTRKRSLRQLENEFCRGNNRRIYKLCDERARILDLISWGLYLSSLETNQYSEYYGISNSKLQTELQDMLDHGVFVLQYFLIPEKLRSLCILADGPVENICSFSRALLKHAPSSQAHILDEGKSSVIVTRVPEDEYHHFVTSLTDSANATEISLKALPISAYVGYRNNLYSRLLKKDGSWDDDVSGLLEQVRLPQKNDEN